MLFVLLTNTVFAFKQEEDKRRVVLGYRIPHIVLKVLKNSLWHYFCKLLYLHGSDLSVCLSLCVLETVCLLLTQCHSDIQ